MIHHITDITILGTSILKGYFLLFMGPGNLLSNLKKEQLKEVDDILKNVSDLKNIDEAREMVTSILFDEFTDKTLKTARNSTLLKKLYNLKVKIINYYLQSPTTPVKQYKELTNNSDIHTTIGQLVLQLMRFRMVIEPEIQITINKHKETKITYLVVKGFWINDKGEKEKKFKRLFGREDDFVKGKQDPKAIEEATKKMQEVLYDEYLKTYPD